MYNITGVSLDQGLQLRPTGLIRPTKTFHPAHEDILSIIKKCISNISRNNPIT